ncbi:MAG: FKBP-type peptidyl-prolyl cis-trans isomerase [Methyloligellaceae bacterium]
MRVCFFGRAVGKLLAAAFVALLPFGGGAHANPQYDYLTTNAKKDGVVTTKTGLQYRILRKGKGKSPKATDNVEVHYSGTLISGKKFDSSYDRGQPAQFPLNRVIPGWTEGVQLMKEGAKYEFVIPSSLGYGTMGAGGSIPPGATLIFVVELLKVN